MRFKKSFLLSVLPCLLFASLVSCNKNQNNNNNNQNEYEEAITFDPQEVGDTVKEWKSRRYLNSLPIDVNKQELGYGDINDEIGQDDKCSLKFVVKDGGHIGSDALEDPFFTEDDAKNGDVISLYFYAPINSNLAAIQLEVLPYSMKDGFKSNLIEIDDNNSNKWVRLVVEAFDTLEPLGAIRLNYQLVDPTLEATFYVDDINVTLGEETQETGYEYNDESLYKAYEDYSITIGACMSDNMMNNTTIRKIARDNFNSLTAENEAKPENVLDKEACQALAASGNDIEVAIKISPFERIYNFCEAHHIKVRHHTFVWYSQTPSWLFNENYADNGARVDRDTMLARMDSFIRNSINAVNERWPGLVYAFDVANEVVENGGSGYNNNNKWYDTIGEDFVYYAFKYASEYKQDDQDLYYNDYAYDYNVSKLEFALDGFLKEAIEEGLVDGIGIQGHIDCDNIRHDIEDAKLIKQRGLKCQITELDITTNNSEDGFSKQKKAYKDMMSQILTLNQSGETDVNAVIVWGINDDASWKRTQVPLLFNSDLSKKPAYYGMLEAAEEFQS